MNETTTETAVDETVEEDEEPRSSSKLDIQRPVWRNVLVEVVGEPPGLLMDAYAKGRDDLAPKAACERALHKLAAPQNGQKYGLPAIGWKQLLVRSAKWAGKNMTDARGWVFVEPPAGEEETGLIPIDAKTWERFTRPVPVGKRQRIEKHSPVFSEWSSQIPVRFMASAITVEGLATLFAIGGECVGVGAYAPRHDCSGPFGKFTVKSVTELDFAGAGTTEEK